MVSVENNESDEKLQAISGQIFVGQAVIVAYHLGLFHQLSNGPLSTIELSQKLGLKVRAVQAIVSCSCALGLLEFQEGTYQLTTLGQKFLNTKSDAWYGDVFDLFIQQHDLMNFETVKRAIISNQPQAGEGIGIFTDHVGIGGSRSFVNALHQKAYLPALHWAREYKLERIERLVDIGGGSGIHTIAACVNNPQLNGVICDREEILPFTREYVDKFGLGSRIAIKKLDMWSDPFPEGDAYFFGDIFHDWNQEKCLFLAQKAFRSLSGEGSIILHEMLFDPDKTGPYLTAAYNMKMMMWTEGQQYSCCEIEDILHQAGFREITMQKSLGNWSLIIGKK
jgi:hypothetical protein